MDPGRVVVGGVALVLGGILAPLAWMFLRRFRAIRATPTGRAGMLVAGPVELRGAAALPPGEAARHGPFSGEPCVFWRIRIEERRTDLRTRRDAGGNVRTERTDRWHTVDSAESPLVIGLDDGSGVARVAAPLGGFPTPARSSFSSGFLRDPSPRIQALLESRGRKFEDWFGMNRPMRYVEDRLPAGTELFVLGTAATTKEGLVVQREGPVPFVVATGGEGSVLVRQAVGAALSGAGAVALLALGSFLIATGLA